MNGQKETMSEKKDNGFIMMQNGLMEINDFKKDHTLVAVYYFLLQLANMNAVDKTRCTIGTRQLATALGITDSKAYRALMKLEKHQIVKREVKREYTCCTMLYAQLRNAKRNTSETQTKTNKEEEERTNTSSVDWKAFIKMWNSIAPEEPGCQINKMTKERKEKINRRIAEMGGKAKLMKLIEKMWKLNYFYGANTNEWYGNLDWLIKNDENWVKLDEGKYDFAGEIQ